MSVQLILLMVCTPWKQTYSISKIFLLERNLRIATKGLVFKSLACFMPDIMGLED